MNMKKVLILTFIIIFSSIYLFVMSWEGGDVKVVRKIPSGFIQLNKGGDCHENGLHYVSWETQISFLDADEICIYQTGFNNYDFIVKYKKEYYINEEKYIELIDTANVINEQRNKIYKIGDIIKLRSDDNPYMVKIDEVKTDIVDEMKVFTINYTIDPNNHMKTRIFDHIETETGAIINNLDFINEDTIQVELAIDEKIKMIILKSPDYANCIRKIGI